MLTCKGVCRNWHLQLVATKFFNQKNRLFNFRNPAWLVLYREDEKEQDLHQFSNNVIDFMDKTGGIVQEIFGLNYNDLMELDRYTYNMIKKAVYKICERRAKEQEEQQRLENERMKKAEQEQQAAMHRGGR